MLNPSDPDFLNKMSSALVAVFVLYFYRFLSLLVACCANTQQRNIDILLLYCYNIFYSHLIYPVLLCEDVNDDD